MAHDNIIGYLFNTPITKLTDTDYTSDIRG